MRTLSTLTATLLLTVFAATAQAQTGACSTSMALVVSPSGWVCITPNTDHNGTTVVSGATVPIVVRYDLLLFGPSVTDTSTGAATQTIDIGKPTINAQGALWVQVAAITALPLGQQYKGRVVAVGQPATAGGPAQVSARSPESNPFIRPVPPPPAPLAPLRISVPA